MPRQPMRALRGLPGTVANLDSATLRWAPGAGTLARAAREVARFVPGVDAGDGSVLDMPSVQAPRTRFNGSISPHRRFAMGQIPLGTVKETKNAAGVSVNDVVVTICASAVREWLLEHDELPEDRLGRWSRCPCAGPRSALMSRAARATVRAAAAGPLRPPLNLIISNVPGPREPLYLAGARLEAHYPVSVITDGVGLNITCMSYLDQIDFGVVCDRDQVDDAWPFITAIERAYRELDEAVCGKRPEAGARTSA